MLESAGEGCYHMVLKQCLWLGAGGLERFVQRRSVARRSVATCVRLG